MKAILEFNLPEDQADHMRAVHARDAYFALWDISQQVFRPARKHGYSDPKLDALLETDAVVEAINLLETKFYEILSSYNIDMDSL